jgi:sugar lactone lactonase YvrE
MLRLHHLAVLLLIAAPAAAQDTPLSQILLEGESWHVAAKSYDSFRRLYADKDGNVYVDYVRKGMSGVDRIDPTGTVSPVEKPSQDTKRAYVPTVKAQSSFSYSVSSDKGTVHASGQASEGAKELVYQTPGLLKPTCLVLSSEDGTLFVGDSGTGTVWAFRVEKDGGLKFGEPYGRPRPGQKAIAVTGLAIDVAGRVYAASPEGVQFFDPTCRLSGVLLKPERADVTAVVFGGPERDRLYVTCGDKVYFRKVRAKGVAAGK